MARGYQGEVVVNGYSEQWLRQGFPWVYPKEVVSKPKRLKPGTPVKLRSQGGHDFGLGLWDTGWIAVRRFPGEHAVDLSDALAAAVDLRDVVVDPETSAYRVVAAENDHLPGIRVDRWGWHLVISLDSASLMPLVDPLCDWLEQRMEPRGIHLAWRIDPRDKGKSGGPPRLLRGHEAPADVRVTERGMAMLVRPKAKDTGLYTDMRDNRAWLEPHWGGRRVLNLFAHTGAFSVSAALNGASCVTSVDLSEAYLDRAEANFVANDLDPGLHEFVASDVRRELDRLRRTGERFDAVVLDPPSFSHGPDGKLSVEKDYGRLVAQSLRVMQPGAWLIAALNHGKVSPKQFHGAIKDGAKKAGRDLQLLFQGGQAADHPSGSWFPEGRYLKFAVFRAL